MLTLAQTGKTVRVPVVLVGTAHWSGPVDWIGQHVAVTGMITDVDAGRLQLTDGPAQVVDWVRRAWQIQPHSLPGPVAPRPPAGGHQWPHTCRKDGRVNHSLAESGRPATAAAQGIGRLRAWWNTALGVIGTVVGLAPRVCMTLACSPAQR